ncbi:hypothetical protein [Quadrisphaera granulorum]|uniref:hypothetical protein n=1 Tax=Quadrisphaera granulorum TaxID=317664 RepID=UPI000D6BEAD9|nr:hypothetical protein [Quadrisphaera granulorum]
MDWWIIVGGLAASLLVVVVRARGAHRRRARLAAGDGVSCRARLGTATGRLQRGRLHLTPDGISWTGSGRHVPLAGVRVLAVSEPPPRGAQQDDALVQLRHPDGHDLRLALHAADAALLVERLLITGTSATGPAAQVTTTGAPSTAPLGPPRRRRWPLVLLALAALWLLGWAYLVLGGRTVSADVVEPLGDGACAVAWTGSSGQPLRSEVDCNDDPAGSAVDLWEFAPPLTHEVADPAWTAGSVLVLALLVAAPGAVGLLLDRRDRRSALLEAASRASACPSGPPPLEELPALTVSDVARTVEAPPVVLARYAPYAHRQVPSGGWQDPRRPAGPGVPSLLRDLPRALAWPVLGLGVVVLLTAPAPWRWWQLETTSTAQAVATSTGEVVVEGPAFVPDEVALTYRDQAGAAHRAEVATTRDLPAGEQVRITHSTSRPGWARIDGPGDGLPRYLLLTGAGAAVALGLAGWRTSRLVIARRRLIAAAAVPDRPALATLTGSPDGEPVLLVCDPVSQPAEVLAVPLQAPLPHGAASAFPADRALGIRARGPLRDGEAVVVHVPGVDAALVPAGPAWTPDSDDLLVLLDAETAFRRALEDGESPSR